MATPSTFRENLLRVIAVVGLIAVLLLGAWGIILLAFNLPSFFGNFGKAKEALTVSAPAQMTSDKAVAVSWKHTGKAEGEYSYAVSYSCGPGLQFAAPVPTGAYQLVPCNTAFNYVNASSSLQIIPVLKAGTAKATTTLTIAATRLSDGVVTIKGSTAATVSASTTATVATTTQAETTKPEVKPTQKPAQTYVPSGRTTNLYGYADLAVQIITSPQSAPAGSRVTLQFVITNVGTNVAQAGWVFNAVLPYNPIYVYPSVGQQALYPGDKIVYTLGYDAVPMDGYNYYGTQSQATINADTNNLIPEANEANNTATAYYQVY